MKKTAKEVNVSQVKVADGFWSGMQEKVIDVVIPFQEKVLNDEVPGVAKSHAIENFRIAAGLSEGEFYGMVFQDSDLAKWLEGVAYSLSVKPLFMSEVIRTIDKRRVCGYVGRLTKEQMMRVNAALLVSVGLDKDYAPVAGMEAS